MYPEHMWSYIIVNDGSRSSPGECTQESDRYAGKTQVERRLVL